jgi:predicted nucleotidyltransferase
MPQLDLSPQHFELLQRLLKKYVSETKVWAFGSRVKGTAHEGSDVDIVLRNPKDLMQATAERSLLVLALQESRLPMLVDVHDWAYLPEDFRRNIEKCYVEIKIE